LKRHDRWKALSLLTIAIACLPASTVDLFAGAAPDRYVIGKKLFTVAVDGIDREFIVYAPRPVRHAPVVFMFHGTSGDGERFFSISGWREKADAEGFIAVFPSALTYCYKEDENGDGDFDDPGERTVTTKWASGRLGTPAMPLCTEDELAAQPSLLRALADHPLMDDVAFVRVMLAILERQYQVDDRRIYASGFSNGASMTSRLVIEMSDRFAAIATSAGALEVAATAAARPVPALFSVGEVDDRFTSQLEVTAIPLAATLFQDLPELYTEIVTPMLTALQLGHANRYAETVVDGAKISGFIWSQSSVGASNDFRFVVIEGLGHQYPNGTNHPITLANVLWQYFRGWSLPPGRR
jgi:polyhydroxybutyrate depolymerase